MRRWAIGLAAALAVHILGLWPFPQKDTGELYIVETLLVEAEAAGVRLSTGDAAGAGATMALAVADLQRQAPGQLFLRQTRRVIFCGGAEMFCDPLSLPRDLPMGTCMYRCGADAAALDVTRLNKVLEARERREETPTLARMENGAITGKPFTLKEIEREAYAGA